MTSTSGQAAAESSKVGYTADERLTRSWHVWLEHRASWKRARPYLPALLLELDSIGCWPGPGDPFDLRPTHERLARQLEALGVSSFVGLDPTDMHPPGFSIMPEGLGWAVPSLEHLPEFLSDWIASDDAAKLRRQLGGVPASVERHAFLVLSFVHPFAAPLDRPADDDDLPPTEPDLVEPVDGVWVTTSTKTPPGQPSRLLAWLPSRGWIHGTRVFGPSNALEHPQ